MSSLEIAAYKKIINSGAGMVLVTGPTGSGKTTTLYATLKELNQEEKNITTIEDPVEYQIEGINQIQVNYKTGLTFPKVLRSVLRQDPDIILVGEIRDPETAKISVQAALTGHLVFATLHTKDVASIPFRLVDMGVEAYLVKEVLLGAISQKLVKLPKGGRTGHFEIKLFASSSSSAAGSAGSGAAS
jgi:type IV pilus assembly protein PilB